MFTGIVADVGTIAEKQDREGGMRLRIATKTLDLSDVKLGDSIAVNGVCLTAVKLESNSFSADVSRETLSCKHGYLLFTRATIRISLPV